MKLLPVWSKEEITADVATAREAFRHSRLNEQSLYNAFFDKYSLAFKGILDALPELHAGKIDPKFIIEEFAENGDGEVLRYLAGPPVSSDDMATLADVKLSRAGLSSKGAVRAVNSILSALLDPRRFPWIAEGRKATQTEIEVAVTSSAALLASQRVQTDRRNRAKEEQEKAVKLLFMGLGYSEARAKPIQLITDAPDPKHLCGSTKLGSKQGDLYVRLPDKRLLAIECKVSNSEVNSFKRVMNDSVGKAVVWRRALGENQVIPAVVLSGVFKPDNILEAQKDIHIIWDHRLTDLKDFAVSIK